MMEPEIMSAMEADYLVTLAGLMLAFGFLRAGNKVGAGGSSPPAGGDIPLLVNGSDNPLLVNGTDTPAQI